MDAVNAATKRVFDLVWAPFDRLPLWVGVLALGVAFGVLALVAMKYTANQKRVERLKDRYQAHILAIKLFRDSFVVVTTSLGKALAWIGVYLGEAMLKPMVVMLVPFMLLFAQMQMRLAYRPLDVGAKALVAVEVADGRSPMEVQVELPPGVAAAGPAVREPSRGRIVVPLMAKEAGVHELRFRVGNETATKTLHAGDLPGAPMVSPVRSADFVDRLLYPSEPAFGSGSSFLRIELAYPVRPITLLGVDLSFGSEWGMCITFLLVTIAAAFGLKGVFGVTI
jgi:hypothetical protein